MFGRGDEVEVVHLAVVHLPLLVGQLARAVAAGSVHHRRRHYLRVSRLARLVEEKVDESPLQTSSPADIDGESRAANLHAEVEVYQVVLLRQLPVGQRVLGQVDKLAAGLHHEVVLRRLALRHLGVGQVGNLQEQLRALLRSLLHLLLQPRRRQLYLRHARLSLLGLVASALLHQRTDALGNLVYLSLELVHLLLGFAAAVVGSEDSLYSLGCPLKVFFLQSADYRVLVVENLFDCKHIVVFSFVFSLQTYEIKSNKLLLFP